MNKENKNIVLAGVKYALPTVEVLHATPLKIAEVAGRTAYDSFDKSEHPMIRDEVYVNDGDIDSSKILNDLAWTYFHHSVLEHININFEIKDMPRGVLVEFTRHRIASYTVKSTRYTMSEILIAYIIAEKYGNFTFFTDKIKELGVFVTRGLFRDIDIKQLYEKLYIQHTEMGDEEFIKSVLSKDAMDIYTSGDNLMLRYDDMIKAKKKRNVGDTFKHVVNDMWATNQIVTINLRSLKNLLKLRDSGSAYFLMRETAQLMKSAIDKKYLDLIVK